jgi:hypothetical protein
MNEYVMIWNGEGRNVQSRWDAGGVLALMIHNFEESKHVKENKMVVPYVHRSSHVQANLQQGLCLPRLSLLLASKGLMRLRMNLGRLEGI